MNERLIHDGLPSEQLPEEEIHIQSTLHLDFELSPAELAEIAELFEELPPCPIDLAKHEAAAEQDEDLAWGYEEMMKAALDYTKDFAHMVHYSKEHPAEMDEERDNRSDARAARHSAAHTAINIYARLCKDRGGDASWKKWDDDNRGACGKFAIHVTAHRLVREISIAKVQRIIDEMAIEPGTQIPYESLKQGKTNIEIQVITYVEILSGILAQDRPVSNEESAKLREISEFLNKDEKEILGAFVEMYQRDRAVGHD